MRGLGLFGLSIPEDYGGLGLNMRRSAGRLRARPDAPAFRSIFGTNVGIGSQGMVMDGTEEQKQSTCRGIASGEIITSFALTEPEAGSDAASLADHARGRDGDHYVLNGAKRFITNAPQGRPVHGDGAHRSRATRAPAASRPSWSSATRRASRSASPTRRWASRAPTSAT